MNSARRKKIEELKKQGLTPKQAYEATKKSNKETTSEVGK